MQESSPASSAGEDDNQPFYASTSTDSGRESAPR